MEKMLVLVTLAATSLVQVGTAALPNDETRGQNQRARRKRRVGHALTECAKGSDGDVTNWLFHGGKRSGKQTRKAHIVEASEPNVIGNANTDASQGLKDLSRKVVIGAEDGVNLLIFRERIDELNVSGVARINKGLWRLQIIVEHGFLCTNDSEINGRGSERALYKDHPAISQFDEVVGE